MAVPANRSLPRVCSAFLGQVHALAEPAGGLSRHQLGRLLFWTLDTLFTLAADTRTTPLPLGEHLHQRELAADDVAEQTSGLMGTGDTTTLQHQLGLQLSELTLVLARPNLPGTVASNFGTVRLIDYLRANTILLVDLALAASGSAQPPALAESVRSLTGVLVERHPGRTIEVRVPPFAAVQIGSRGEGPTHTRGTPPNVVETDPGTFLALATARQSWTRALASGALSCSGAQAQDTARVFPIFCPGK